MKLVLSRADLVDDAPFVVEIVDNPHVEAEVLIGRARDCDVQIEEPFVSRHHCTIVIDMTGQSLHVRDLGSRNGTFVNDRRVEGLCEAHEGDTITVGYLPLTIGIADESSIWERIDARCRQAPVSTPRQIKFGALADQRPSAHGRPT